MDEEIMDIIDKNNGTPLILGRHIMTTHGFETAVKYGKECNADIIQIFMRAPQNFNIKQTSKDKLEILRKDSKELNVKIVIHGSYIANLCRPFDDTILQKSIKSIIQDMNESIFMDAIGVVIHMGHNTCNITDEDAYNNYIKNVKYILKNTSDRSTLILETGAGQGHEIATNINELGEIRNRLTKKEKHRVKFCLDTCHMYSAGYNLGDIEFVDIMEKYIESVLGWNNIALIHLNDSKYGLNAKMDRHADIGKGKIEINGLIKFIDICRKKHIPIVFETPAKTYNNKKLTIKEQIKYVRELFNLNL